MKYLDEYRDPRAWPQRLLGADPPHGRRGRGRSWRSAAARRTRSSAAASTGCCPPSVELVHGPGCPVCVTPLEHDRPGAGHRGAAGRDLLLVRRHAARARLARRPAAASGPRAATCASSTRRSTPSASPHENPDGEVVFFAVGFETTAPAQRHGGLRRRKRLGLANFSMLVSHVLVPPAMEAILAVADQPRAGLPRPPGTSARSMGFERIRGARRRYRVPIVVTGFEPVDLLEGILMLVRQLEAGRHEVENQYARAVRAAGNPAAASRSSPRSTRSATAPGAGLGVLPRSGLRLRAGLPRPRRRGALRRSPRSGPIEPAECRSGEVLRGLLRPDECPAFGTRCTPEHPLGAPMVSSEGACAAYWKYGRRSRAVRASRAMESTQPRRPGPRPAPCRRRRATASCWPTARAGG